PRVVPSAYGAAFLAGGERILLADYDGPLRAWDIAADRATSLPSPASRIESLAASSTGAALVAALRSRAVVILDGDSGTVTRTLGKGGAGGAPPAIAISPSGRRALVGAQGGSVTLYDVGDAAAVRTLLGHTGPVQCVAFADDARFASGGTDDASICLWREDAG